MLTIGAFSRLAHVSIRMLRHYDAIGLLPPAHVDAESGYRHYTWQQLETISRIETLKQFRFSLTEIGQLLHADEMAIDLALHEKRLLLYRELDSLQRTVRRLESQIGKMEDIEMEHQAYQVTVMQCPQTRIFGLRRTIHIGQVHGLFSDLRDEMALRGLTQSGAGLYFFHGDEYSYESQDVEAAFPVAQEHPDTRLLPAGPYVATIHHGPYETIKNAYEAIGQWAQEHPEYEILGPSFERYIRDETDGISPEDYETGVLFPVKSV